MRSKCVVHWGDKEGMKKRDGLRRIQKEQFCFLVIDKQFLEP